MIESHISCVDDSDMAFAIADTWPRNTTQLLLTKGDNNDGDDIMLYGDLDWIERKHIIGKVRG